MSAFQKLSGAWTRWGLLVTTIVLALLLVFMSGVGFLSARRTSDSISRARAVDLMLSLRRSLNSSGGNYQDALEDYLEDHQGQGVEFAGIYNRRDGVLGSAGSPSSRVELADLVRQRVGREPIVLTEGNRVRVVAPLAPRRRRAVRDRVEKRRSGRGWLQKRGKRPWFERRTKNGPEADPRSADEGSSRPRGGLVVLDFEPVVAARIVRRAGIMLIISLAAASVLLLVAIVFWRASRRAELLSEQLAKDSQLRALGEMSAVLGHELRNPLASLKGHAQLLVERLDENHRGRRGAETIVREAIRMEKLTEQILEFARTGALDLAPNDPGELARAAVEQTGFGGIELQIADGLPQWTLDRLRLERVLINLVRNAVQASSSEGVVNVRVAMESNQLVFEVRDRGEGLPPGEEQWIFEPFHTKRVRGTGLGLAVSKRIVESHGGTISARNHPQGGAVFTIRLPQSKDAS